ncbi:hypothetical protein JCM10213_001566 [Rhodosporidiobolus nylandii]
MAPRVPLQLSRELYNLPGGSGMRAWAHESDRRWESRQRSGMRGMEEPIILSSDPPSPFPEILRSEPWSVVEDRFLIIRARDGDSYFDIGQALSRSLEECVERFEHLKAEKEIEDLAAPYPPPVLVDPQDLEMVDMRRAGLTNGEIAREVTEPEWVVEGRLHFLQSQGFDLSTLPPAAPSLPPPAPLPTSSFNALPPPPPTLTDRDERIIELRKQGKTFAEVAKEVGSSKDKMEQRVKKLRKAGVDIAVWEQAPPKKRKSNPKQEKPPALGKHRLSSSYSLDFFHDDAGSLSSPPRPENTLRDPPTGPSLRSRLAVPARRPPLAAKSAPHVPPSAPSSLKRRRPLEPAQPGSSARPLGAERPFLFRALSFPDHQVHTSAVGVSLDEGAVPARDAVPIAYSSPPRGDLFE